jgi:hypothetical protein
MTRFTLALPLALLACSSTPAPPPTDLPRVDASRDLSPGVDLARHDRGPSVDRRPGPDLAPAVVDPATLEKKVLFGYQGWFACPGDGSPVNAWVHWFRAQEPIAANATFDAWPDVSELHADEECPTSLTLSSGKPAILFSSQRAKTVDRHFAWMKQNAIDGVFLQRFTVELGDPKFLAHRDKVTANVRAGAEAHGRVFAIMYDVSGQDPATLAQVLKQDWAHLVDTLQLTASPRYLRHAGRPVLALWGLGFSDRPGTPQEAQSLIDHFRTGAPAAQRVTLVGGVPTYWRTLKSDSKTDPAWAAVYRSFDVVSPWSVGRYGDASGADSFKKNLIVPDLAELKTLGKGYLPVVFPGFSWHNLFPSAALNQIPRDGGKFYWRQVWNALSAGSTMLYVAMFDEVDEGTAMFKLAPKKSLLPVEGSFLSLDADGVTLPSDFYLRLGGATGQALRGEIPLSATLPITP